MVKMLVLYKTPKDKDAFDKHYHEVHIPLTKKLPGFVKYEISQGDVMMPGGTSSVYLIGTVYFESMEKLKEAFASPAGRACAKDRCIMAPEEEDSKMYIFEMGEV